MEGKNFQKREQGNEGAGETALQFYRLNPSPEFLKRPRQRQKQNVYNIIS